MKILKYTPILSLLVLFSCEKEIPLEAEQVQPRIVINSQFEAGDSIFINLSESRDILYNQNGALPNITDGNAVLQDASGNDLATFTHLTDGNYYVSNPFPLPGETYQIKVNKTGFTEVTSSTFVPSPLTINSIDTVTVNNKMEITVSFSDDGSQSNYYAISAISFAVDSFEVSPGVIETYVYESYWMCTKDFNVAGAVADEEGEYCSDEFLISDAGFNGQTYSLKFTKYLDEMGDDLVIVLKSVSEDMYKYKVSMSKYLEVQGNPFAEPVQVYSNVNNGFGIFAGYSVYSDTLEL